MYRKKLYLFGAMVSAVMLLALALAATSALITRANLEQSAVAQNLLMEHQQLSSISYRLFKQLTDELIFGESANQAAVRNKQTQIEASLQRIRRLEQAQRESLGKSATEGSIEDTDDLAMVIDTIIREFRQIAGNGGNTPLASQERVRTLLEDTIDNQFREAINTATARQTRVVTALNARISTLNSAMVWFSGLFALVSLPLVIWGCSWLFAQLYRPLESIRRAADAIARGHYQVRFDTPLDKEFATVADAFNILGERLAGHEQQANRLQQQLATEVDQRTRELVAANQRLTTLDQQRRQFLADVSHELRTPLTIIRGETQVLLRQQDVSTANYRETLDTVLQQSLQLSQLVDDLLLLARTDSDSLRLDIQKHTMADWLAIQFRRWKKLDPQREWRLEQDLDGVTLAFDDQRLAQVLGIVIDNARQYSTPGSPIVISAGQDGRHGWIRVTNQGAGILPQDIPRIFERFVRLRRSGRGAGLGLAIAKTIIEAHGGTIEVDSQVDRDTRFTLTLPIGTRT
ncbi:MAG: ATP-binding protein [Oleiphilaceae bacterium]|nr:ATP-binding protein [Oleiphilaceae bacterium]